MRALVRRDRNHPCVVLWSIGNEIAEQGMSQRGAAIAPANSRASCTRKTRRGPRPPAATTRGPAVLSPLRLDVIGVNYQGSRPSREQPYGNYPLFHEASPKTFLYGSETASTISSRGEYIFPVAAQPGAVSGGGRRRDPNAIPPGQDVAHHQMSSYDLYYPGWATSPDTEFAAQDRFPFVGGEFVWTGWDYLGEPTPWGGRNDPSRSSYFGIIDLAGFKKDRFYLYQARWRPELPMAHILPHWNWPDRVGQVTPVHVYTSGDEAELFLNGKSLGKKNKGQYEYRLRWDDVVYEPGELKVVAYKNGKEWARDTVKTTGPAAKLLIAGGSQPDRGGRPGPVLRHGHGGGQGRPAGAAVRATGFASPSRARARSSPPTTATRPASSPSSPTSATPSTACAWPSCKASRGRRGPLRSRPSPKGSRVRRSSSAAKPGRKAARSTRPPGEVTIPGAPLRKKENHVSRKRRWDAGCGQRIEDHFVDITEMIEIGKGGQRSVKTIQELGGTMPENLPPAESIKKLEAKKRKQPKAMQKPSNESQVESNSNQAQHGENGSERCT